MEIRETSEAGLKFLIKEEGLVLRPYLDSVKVPTIGVGSTYYEDGRKVKMTDPPITAERAIRLFKNLLKNYELAVYSNTRDDINHNQFDAMASLCYNIGVNGFRGSTLVKRVNQNPNQASIRAAFQMWKNAGGKPILLARRNREADLYFKPQKVETFKLTPELMYDEHIKHIQKAIGVKADGWYGPATERAVREFQKYHGLTPDGIAGPRTMEFVNQILI